MAGHCVVGYFWSCHSRSPASRAELSVPTIYVGHHCLAATGLMPGAVQSRAIEATDSPWSSTRAAASRIASGLYRVDLLNYDVPLLVLLLIGISVDARIPRTTSGPAGPSALSRLPVLGFPDPARS